MGTLYFMFEILYWIFVGCNWTGYVLIWNIIYWIINLFLFYFLFFSVFMINLFQMYILLYYLLIIFEHSARKVSSPYFLNIQRSIYKWLLYRKVALNTVRRIFSFLDKLSWVFRFCFICIFLQKFIDINHIFVIRNLVCNSFFLYV